LIIYKSIFSLNQTSNEIEPRTRAKSYEIFEWSTTKRNLKRIYTYLLKNPRYILLLFRKRVLVRKKNKKLDISS